MNEKYIELALQLGVTILIILVGYIVIKIICGIVKKTMVKGSADDALIPFAVNTTRVVLWILTLVTALGFLGIPPTAFLTAIGAAGVAIALALRESLGNFAGGILIIITKPFSKGDYIEDYETAGKVDKIDLLYTTLTTYDNKTITIPNGKLANSTVVNYTRAEKRRVDCIFGIGYHDDIAKAKDVLWAVAESNDLIFKDPEPTIGVANHSDSQITLDMKVWCDTDDYWDVKYFLEETVKIAFDEAGLSIPYPQLDVHLKGRIRR